MPVLINEEKPLTGEMLVPYEKPLVDAVEHLIRLARRAGGNGTISTEKHWEITSFIFNLWTSLYPQEYTDFRAFQARQKHDQKNNAVAREKGGAMVQHQLEIPRKFHDLLAVIFPKQKYDKVFVAKLAQRMPLLNLKA